MRAKNIRGKIFRIVFTICDINFRNTTAVIKMFKKKGISIKLKSKSLRKIFTTTKSWGGGGYIRKSVLEFRKSISLFPDNLFQRRSKFCSCTYILVAN